MKVFLNIQFFWDTAKRIQRKGIVCSRFCSMCANNVGYNHDEKV